MGSLIQEPTLRDLIHQHLGVLGVMRALAHPSLAEETAFSFEGYLAAVARLSDRELMDGYRIASNMVCKMTMSGLSRPVNESFGFEIGDVYLTPGREEFCRTERERHLSRSLQRRRTDGPLRHLLIEDTLAQNRATFSIVDTAENIGITVEDIGILMGDPDAAILKHCHPDQAAGDLQALSDWDLLRTWHDACLCRTIVETLTDRHADNPDDRTEEEGPVPAP